MDGTLDKKPVVPTFTDLHTNTYFPFKYGNPHPADLQALNWFPYLPKHDEDFSVQPFNLDPVRSKDVKATLSKKSATSAPGPDGIMYGILRKLPATHHILATIFTKLLNTWDPPQSWSNSFVTLIYKAGDTTDPQNFRMIALTSCVGKLFHQILSERISSYMLRTTCLTIVHKKHS